MTQLPTLTTERLLLRPFDLNDAPIVKELAGEREIAETTSNIPHPYENGMAEEWIATHQKSFDKEEVVTFAIELIPDGPFIGAISLLLSKAHRLAELGYWIGKPYWNQGYCSEAAKEVVKYGFETLQLNRIQARHMTKNPASGRVLQKLGMSQEGNLRQSLRRFGSFEDAAIYSILRDEYNAQ